MRENTKKKLLNGSKIIVALIIVCLSIILGLNVVKYYGEYAKSNDKPNTIKVLTNRKNKTITINSSNYSSNYELIIDNLNPFSSLKTQNLPNSALYTEWLDNMVYLTTDFQENYNVKLLNNETNNIDNVVLKVYFTYDFYLDNRHDYNLYLHCDYLLSGVNLTDTQLDEYYSNEYNLSLININYLYYDNYGPSVTGYAPKVNNTNYSLINVNEQINFIKLVGNVPYYEGITIDEWSRYMQYINISVNNSIDYSLNYINGFNNGVNSVINAPSDYDLYNQTQYENHYNNGYQLGFDEGVKSDIANNGFKSLMSTIFNSPYNMLKGIFNFELFGVNLFNLLSFIFTTTLIIALVKLIK